MFEIDYHGIGYNLHDTAHVYNAPTKQNNSLFDDYFSVWGIPSYIDECSICTCITCFWNVSDIPQGRILGMSTRISFESPSRWPRVTVDRKLIIISQKYKLLWSIRHLSEATKNIDIDRENYEELRRYTFNFPRLVKSSLHFIEQMSNTKSLVLSRA